MIRNYIEFKYDEDGYLIAKISRDGKYRIIRNIDNIFKLIDIAEKYNYTIDSETRIVKDARYIIDEYDKLKKGKTRKFNLYNKTEDNMKIKRSNNNIGKKIAAISLATTMALTGTIIAKTNQKKNNDSEVVKGQYIVTDYENNNSNYSDYLESIKYEEKEQNSNNTSVTPKNEISNMIEKKEFHFSYEDRTSSENIDNVNQYDDIFEKYANMYGLDSKLLKAIACQESGGNHYENLGNGPAEGIMQIEKSVHIGEILKQNKTIILK